MNLNLLKFILFVITIQGQPAVTSTASISGRVFRASTEDTLSKVIVDLRSADSTVVLSTTTTEGDGRFVFPQLPPGEYQVAAMRSGYVTAVYGRRVLDGPALSIAVAPGQKVDNLRITMTPSGTITGSVFDSGRVVGNAIVQTLKTTFKDGKSATFAVKETVTNDLGEYRLFGLPPGKYFVDVLARSEAQGSDSLVVNSQGTDGFTSGRAQGQLDAGRDTVPQRDESYIPTFYPGSVSRSSASAIDVGAGEEIPNINIVTTRVHVIHIRGTVLEDRTGEPLIPGMLQLLPVDAPSKSISLYNVTKNGTFEFSGVIPGSYILNAVAGDRSARMTIEARDRDIDSVTLRLVALIKIPIHVRVEGENGKPPDPSIITSISVGRAPFPLLSGLSGSTRTLSPAGTETLPGVLPGNYRLYVSPLQDWNGARPAELPPALASAYVKSIRLGEIDILKDGLQVDRQPEGTIEIVIGTSPGAIAGRIQGAPGDSVQGLFIVALPNTNRDYLIDRIHSTSTDASGTFRLEGLPPGDYKLFAWDAIEKNAWLDPEFMLSFEDLGHPFHVNEGSSQIVILPVIQRNPGQ